MEPTTISVELTLDEIEFLQHLILYRELVPRFDQTKETHAGIKLLAAKCFFLEARG